MRKVIKGNHAVSHGVRLSRVQVISAYPITPQTTIVEELSNMCATGQLDARYIKVESEHSAMAAVVGSATAGARSFTATSSQGLLLMHEVLHWAAGARLPIVLANVNRSVGPGWNIWAEQTDSLAQRDTGWIQIYCESNQEVLDTVIMAFKLAETILLPVMLTYDAFFLSHTSEIVDVPENEDVDRFLPPYTPPYMLDVNNPKMFGGITMPDWFYEGRYKMHRDSLTAFETYSGICDDFDKQFNRRYDLIEAYRTDDAEVIVVTAGTTTSVTRIVVDQLRDEGRKVGLMKVRMLRPAPVEAWRSTLKNARKVLVIDRNLIPGMGGVFAQEILAALCSLDQRPLIFQAVAGLGGRDITPENVRDMVEDALAAEKPADEPMFCGLKQ